MKLASVGTQRTKATASDLDAIVHTSTAHGINATVACSIGDGFVDADRESKDKDGC
jgi:hypothetical protein